MDHSDTSHRPTGEAAPSSYHPVISQDFNPLKTTIGNQDDDIPNSSGLKSNNGKSGNVNNPHMLSSSDNLKQSHAKDAHLNYMPRPAPVNLNEPAA